MKASEAFFKGEFNEAEFRWEGPELCTVILHNRRTGEIGSFKARHKPELGFLQILEDEAMRKLMRPEEPEAEAKRKTPK